MNKKIREWNSCPGKKSRKEVSKHEFWKFIGIIIVAAPIGKGGRNLFDKGGGRQGWTKPTNLGSRK